MNHLPAHAGSLLACLDRLAQLTGTALDPLALQEAAEAAAPAGVALAPLEQLAAAALQLRVAPPQCLEVPCASMLPALVHGGPAEGWGVVVGKDGRELWVAEWWDPAGGWIRTRSADCPGGWMAVLNLVDEGERSATVSGLIRAEFLGQRRLLADMLIGAVLVNLVALAGSLYSMQVYDRVVPTGAAQTLLVLTLGALGALLFELLVKHVRAGLHDRLIDQLDRRLARAIFMRLLAIRLDQLPHSVGGLAGQLRGYETVRAFVTTICTSVLVDAPFALLFGAVVWLIGGALALIPAAFFGCALLIGIHSYGRVQLHALGAMGANNRRTGLLVETVEGAEVIKSGNGGWRMLGRWMQATDGARASELAMRRIGEHAQHLAAAFQQTAYILIVAAGALLVSRGELTMGSLIACSILSGRILAPAAAVPGLLVQWAHTRSALHGLEHLWTLARDHQDAPALLPEGVRGAYRLESVMCAYGLQPALDVASLNVAAGEKVAVLGPIGAGKTTLLRLLSGMYRPQQGRITLDDIDLDQFAKPLLAEQIAYVPQDGRLFAGSLRDNLLLGQIDPGDETLLAAARRTGLLDSVIAPHPRGLRQEIHEGGSGLSGGQRQLVNLTRALLRQPAVWLLDEPTAAMDAQLERRLIATLRDAFRPGDTVVLVTHKTELLELVDRIVVVANHRIVMDGPKAQVLRALHNPLERVA